jgi:diaminopimelate epimerase
MMMKVEFYKYQGTGNDFVVLDNRNGQYSGLDGAQIEKLCDRKFGIGSDGLMMLELEEGYDFKMVYYNADGNLGSMCGNGGRCLVRFAHDMGIYSEHYKFMATDGEHEAFIRDGRIHLKMQDVYAMESRDQVKILNTGSPHYVSFVDNVEGLDVFVEGRKIRYGAEFQEKGINVNFVCPHANGIRVRTYERGVEDETLSCGTGVTAAAIAHSSVDGRQEVAIKVEGGALAVSFNRISEQQYEDIWLIGPAAFVYKGDINL